MNKIVFFYPSRLMGGAEYLFIRSSIYLSQYNYEVYYVDYIDGFARDLLKTNNKIIHIEYIEGCFRGWPFDSIVITPLSLLPYIGKFCVDIEKFKFLFWSINPYNLKSFVYSSYFRRYLISKERRKIIGTNLEELISMGGLKFMDYNNFYINKNAFLLNSNKPSFLPIFIEDFNVCSPASHNCEFKSLSFLWLGRLDDDKYKNVSTLFNELESLFSRYNVQLYIIGGGSKEKYLKDLSENYSFNIFFQGRICGSELDKFINEKIDIGIAMGTASLNIAKMGKPVLLQNFSKKVYKSDVLNDYILLSESENFDVVSPGYYDTNMGDSFLNKVTQIVNNYDYYAKECQEFVRQNFVITNGGRLLRAAINDLAMSDSYNAQKAIIRITCCIDRNNFFLWIYKKIYKIKNLIFLTN